VQGRTRAAHRQTENKCVMKTPIEYANYKELARLSLSASRLSSSLCSLPLIKLNSPDATAAGNFSIRFTFSRESNLPLLVPESALPPQPLLSFVVRGIFPLILLCHYRLSNLAHRPAVGWQEKVY
jgi:hypothetical protein